ncbi:MAG: CAP domain-containing protein [Acidimicrobiia bacterium]
MNAAVLAMILALVMVVVAAGPAVAGGAAVDPGLEQCLLGLHNAERTARGLHPLIPEPSLTGYARDWSFEMYNSGDFRHSDLSFPGNWWGRSENISYSYGYGSQCQSHHDAFMNSPGHKANILRASSDRVGVGIVVDPADHDLTYVTVVFGDSDGSSGPAPIPPFPPSPCTGSCAGFAAVDAGGRWSVFDKVGDNTPNTFYFGNPGDVPFMGDWDGDGVATPGLYRQSDGFVYLRNSNTQGNADIEFYFGNPGDVPIAGDWDGDGDDTVSIYRPSEGRFYIVNELGVDGGGLGAADFSFMFGNVGDTPFVGDFNGNGRDSVGLHRASTGYSYFRYSLTTGVADRAFFYGNPGDRIMAGDWNGNGTDTVAVYRPSQWHLYVKLHNTPGAADWDAYLGQFKHVVSMR